MFIKNNAELNVSNGTMGKVEDFVATTPANNQINKQTIAHQNSPSKIPYLSRLMNKLAADDATLLDAIEQEQQADMGRLAG